MKNTALRLALSGALLTGSLLATAPMSQAASSHAATQHCVMKAGAVKVEDESSPMTVQVLDSRTGQLVDVVVTITGTTFTVTSADPTVEVVDASWCIKSSTKTNSGTGTTGVSGSYNKKGKTQDISYVLLYGVTTKPVVATPPVNACNTLTTSGGYGVTENTVELGKTGPTSFTITYDTYTIPDQIEVFYQGQKIADTGVISGPGTLTVSVPAGTSTQVMVRVTGTDTGTAWEYQANCPAA